VAIKGREYTVRTVDMRDIPRGGKSRTVLLIQTFVFYWAMVLVETCSSLYMKLSPCAKFDLHVANIKFIVQNEE